MFNADAADILQGPLDAADGGRVFSMDGPADLGPDEVLDATLARVQLWSRCQLAADPLEVWASYFHPERDDTRAEFEFYNMAALGLGWLLGEPVAEVNGARTL